MVEKDLRFITDAMIEASGALHVAVTDQNHVINIITKLERAICKARTLESSRLMPLTDALDCSREQAGGFSDHATEALKQHVDNIQSEQCIPPPIPHQDLGKADQSPRHVIDVLQSPYGGVDVHLSDDTCIHLDDDVPTRRVR